MIKIKPKKCKGTTPQTKGFGCGKETLHRVYGLGKMCGCYSDWLLNTEAGRLKINSASLKATKPRKDFEKAKAEKKGRGSLSKEIEKTQRIVNDHVRQRDYGKPCISQNIPYQKDFEAGHCYSKKQYSAIRFDLDNIHGQSIYANRFLEGDQTNYLVNLPKRIGKEAAEALKLRAEECKRSTKKWTFEELKEIQNKIKELKKDTFS